MLEEYNNYIASPIVSKSRCPNPDYTYPPTSQNQPAWSGKNADYFWTNSLPKICFWADTSKILVPKSLSLYTPFLCKILHLTFIMFTVRLIKLSEARLRLNSKPFVGAQSLLVGVFAIG